MTKNPLILWLAVLLLLPTACATDIGRIYRQNHALTTELVPANIRAVVRKNARDEGRRCLQYYPCDTCRIHVLLYCGEKMVKWAKEEYGVSPSPKKEDQ